MGNTVVTPAYGMWLKNHLSLYEFRTEEAKRLQHKILQTDMTDPANRNAVNELYLAFVSMFCNSMHCIGFECANNDIISRDPQAYLVLNEYGVMAPIQFMRENGKQAEYDRAESAETCLTQMKEAEKNLTEQTKEQLSQSSKVLATHGYEAPSKGKAIAVLILALLVIVGCLDQFDVIKYDIKTPYLAIMWGGIAIILVAFIILAVIECRNDRNRKKLLLNIKKSKNVPQQSIVQPGVINFENYINEYSAQLKTLQLTEFKKVPPASKTFLQIIKEQKFGINETNPNSYTERSLRGYIGTVTIAALLFMNLFIYYGIDHWNYHVNDNGQMEVKAKSEATVVNPAQQELKISQIITGYDNLVVQSVDASSELMVKSSGKVYSGMNASDGEIKTCWQDGVDGDGIGERLTFHFGKEAAVAGFEIVNGCVTSKQRYYNNSRLSDFTLTCYGTDGELIYEEEFHLEDEFSTEPVRVMFDKGQVADCDSVELTINGVYKGKKYKDTCLSEVTFIKAIYE